MKTGSENLALLLRFIGVVTARDRCLTAEHFISTRILCEYIGRLYTQELSWWTGRIRKGLRDQAVNKNIRSLRRNKVVREVRDWGVEVGSHQKRNQNLTS